MEDEPDWSGNPVDPQCQDDFYRSLPGPARAICLPRVSFEFDEELRAEFLKNALNREGILQNKPRPSLWRQWVMLKGESWLPRCARVARRMGAVRRADVWQSRAQSFEDERIDWL